MAAQSAGGAASPHLRPAPPAYLQCVERVFDAGYERGIALGWHELVAAIEAHMAARRHCRRHLKRPVSPVGGDTHNNADTARGTGTDHVSGCVPTPTGPPQRRGPVQ